VGWLVLCVRARSCAGGLVVGVLPSPKHAHRHTPNPPPTPHTHTHAHTNTHTHTRAAPAHRPILWYRSAHCRVRRCRKAAQSLLDMRRPASLCRAWLCRMACRRSSVCWKRSSCAGCFGGAGGGGVGLIKRGVVHLVSCCEVCNVICGTRSSRSRQRMRRVSTPAAAHAP
jgi:hypothetical protein